MRAEWHASRPDEVAATWDALWRDEHTPFMTRAWAEAWWRHYGAGHEPVTITVHDGSEVAGLAPFALRRQGPLRVLVGVGVDPGDWWDVLAAPERRDAVAAAVARALMERAGAWDAAVLRVVSPRPGLIEALEAAGARAGVRRPIPAPAIELPDSFDAYLRTLPASRRQNLRRHLKRLDSGAVTLREAGVDELGAVLDRWQAFREQQWAAQGKDINPEHLSPRFRAFIEDVARALVPDGCASVWEFGAGAEAAGVYVNFCDAENYFWYLGGFAPQHAGLGLGKIAIGHGIRTSIEAGRRWYDFARGAEPYKYWYGASDRWLGGVVLGSGRVRSRAALAAAAVAARRRA